MRQARSGVARNVVFYHCHPRRPEIGFGASKGSLPTITARNARIASRVEVSLDCYPKVTMALDESGAPFYKWFEDGEINASYNCLERNLQSGNANRTAIIFEADDGTVTRVTYQELYHRVCRLANGLKSRGIKKGDRVIIYIPMSIEGV